MQPGRALAVLFAVNCLNIYDRQVLAALAEPVRRQFGLSDTQLGALTTLFTVVYAVAGLPLGRMADRGSRKRLLAAGVTVWAALTAVGAMAASYTMLLASRVGVAIGEAVCAPAATSWIGDLFPPRRRSRALAVFMFGVPAGVALSYAVSGPVGQAFGWRMAMLLAAAPAVLLAPALLLLPEPPRGASGAAAAGPASPADLLRSTTFQWIIASGALVNAGLYGFSAFLPALLMRFHGLSLREAGLWAGVGSGAAGIAGGLAAGWWGDRIASGGAGARMRAAAMGALAAAPIAAAGLAVQPGGVAAAIPLLMAAYGLLNMYYGLVYAAIQDIVAPHLRGTAMALYFLAMYLCGAGFGPLLTGSLSDALARRAAAAGAGAETARAAGLHHAMLVVPALALALAAVLWAGSRAARRAR